MDRARDLVHRNCPPCTQGSCIGLDFEMPPSRNANASEAKALRVIPAGAQPIPILVVFLGAIVVVEQLPEMPARGVDDRHRLVSPVRRSRYITRRPSTGTMGAARVRRCQSARSANLSIRQSLYTRSVGRHVIVRFRDDSLIKPGVRDPRGPLLLAALKVPED